MSRDGKKTANMSDFKLFLCGDDSRGIPGLLTETLASVDKTEVCVDTCRKYANHLGYVFTKVSEGTFTDKHESEENVADRNDRFLPQYLHYYRNSPHLTDFHGQEVSNDMHIVPVDSDGTVVTIDKDADIKHTVHMETIVGGDGVERTFVLGGKIPQGDGPVYMLVSHNESCCKAGEYQERAWAHKDDKQVCRDKSQGPSLHIASFSVEW